VVIVDAGCDNMRFRLQGLKNEISALRIVVGQGGRNVGAGDLCQTVEMCGNALAKGNHIVGEKEDASDQKGGATGGHHGQNQLARQ
jgi:hypothetical protein